MSAEQADNESHGLSVIVSGPKVEVKVDDAISLIREISEVLSETGIVLHQELSELFEEVYEKISEKLSEEIAASPSTSSLGEIAEWAIIGTVIAQDGPTSELRERLEVLDSVFGLRHEENDSGVSQNVEVADESERQVEANIYEELSGTEANGISADEAAPHNEVDGTETTTRSSLDVSYNLLTRELEVDVGNINAVVDSIFSITNESVLPKAFDLMELTADLAVDFYFSTANLLEETGKELSDVMQDHVVFGYGLLSEESAEVIQDKLELIKEYTEIGKDVYDPIGEFGKAENLADELKDVMTPFTNTFDEFNITGADEYENGYDYSAQDYHEQNNWTQESYESEGTGAGDNGGDGGDGGNGGNGGNGGDGGDGGGGE